MEREFTENSPALAVIYGDVNSALGAALAGAKLGVPLAHVEAGLRSFDDSMPEEINRRLTDQLCALLFVTSPEAIGHLAREGRPVGTVHLVGNPMIDTLLAGMAYFDTAAVRAGLGLPDRYAVATLHRPSNVDDPAAAAGLVLALHEVADEIDVVIPVHPRGRAALEAAGIGAHPRLHAASPLGYLEFICGTARPARGSPASSPRGWTGRAYERAHREHPDRRGRRTRAAGRVRGWPACRGGGSRRGRRAGGRGRG
jgi:UDP-N-acetylglucosamine 2-epimerase (non-hydrolysing)